MPTDTRKTKGQAMRINLYANTITELLTIMELEGLETPTAAIRFLTHNYPQFKKHTDAKDLNIENTKHTA